MPEPTLAVANIMLSNAIIYRAVIGTALPPDSLPWDSPWAAPWQRVGLTSAETTMAYEFDEVSATIQETLGDVNRWKTAERALLETTLAEVHLKLLQGVWGGVYTDVAAAAGVPPVEVLTLGGDQMLPKYAYGFNSRWIKDDNTSWPVRVKYHRMTAVAGGPLVFNRTAVTQGTTLKLRALADPSRSINDQLFEMRRITGVGL